VLRRNSRSPEVPVNLDHPSEGTRVSWLVQIRHSETRYASVKTPKPEVLKSELIQTIHQKGACVTDQRIREFGVREKQSMLV
jgi:hypothetical protein